MTTTTQRNFIILPDDTAEEVINDGAETTYWSKAGLYAALVEAGYPLHRDEAATFDNSVDLSIDGTTVTAYSGREEKVMEPEVAEVFLRWYRANAVEEN